MPTGISIGARRFLDIVSAIKSNNVPINADTGINLLCFGPIIFLPICGAINLKMKYYLLLLSIHQIKLLHIL